MKPPQSCSSSSSSSRCLFCSSHRS